MRRQRRSALTRRDSFTIALDAELKVMQYSFLMDYFSLSFVEALKELCQKAGVHFPEDQSIGDSTPESKKQHQILSDHKKLLLTAARYYRSRLASDSVAISYLQKRGISGEVAAKFHIGYAGIPGTV